MAWGVFLGLASPPAAAPSPAPVPEAIPLNQDAIKIPEIPVPVLPEPEPAAPVAAPVAA